MLILMKFFILILILMIVVRMIYGRIIPKNFFYFSVDLGQPMPLNQQPDRNNKASSSIMCNRRFDKQRRKRSSRGVRR